MPRPIASLTEMPGVSPRPTEGSQFSDPRWLVLEDLLRAGGEFYQSSAAHGPVRKRAPAAKRGRTARAKLRERDPW